MNNNSFVHIKPAKSLLTIDYHEYWQARYMFAMLVWKKVKSSFGEMYFWFLWVCLRPLTYVAIFTIFKKWSQARTGVDIPYVLYIYSGLIAWYYFMETAIEVSVNIRANAALVSKIYIPRLITPTVPVVANLIDLSVSFVPLVIMMLFYRVYPGWNIFMLLPTLFVIMLMAMGLGLMVAAITIRLRDFQKILEFTIYAGMFMSPVIFSPQMIPEKYKVIYNFNPMVGVLLGWRSAIFGQISFPWEQWWYSLSFACAIFLIGFYMYRKHEHELIEAL